jgi:hypothetical protein
MQLSYRTSSNATQLPHLVKWSSANGYLQLHFITHAL